MNKQIKYGVILTYAQMALNIIINLIYTPIMINILGDTQYGIYNLTASIISYLNLLSLGFGASYLRFYSIRKSKDDEVGINKLNGLYLIVFTFIGIVAMICGLIIANNINCFFNDTYSANDIQIAKKLVYFLTFNLAISFPVSIFSSYITSQEKFIFSKIVNTGRTILSPCLCIAFLFLGYGSIGMVVATTVVSIVIDVINIVFCFSKLKMSFLFKNTDWKLLKEIAVFSFFIAINQIIDQINWQTDKIILGKMIDATAVAVYTVAATINTLYLSFSTAISSVFAPRINLIVSKGGDDMDARLNEIFIKIGRVQFFILGLILSGFIFFGSYFIKIWVGDTYNKAYYIALLLICPVTIALIQNIGIEIQRAKNKHKFRSIVYLIMAIINVVISIFFCKSWGEIGVALGTTISLVIANVIIMNIYYHKKLGINMIRFWKSILSILPSMAFPIIFGVFIKAFYEFSNKWIFLIMILGYSLVYLISIYLFGFNREEKGFVKKVFMKEKV